MPDAGIDAIYPGPDLNPGKPKYAIPGGVIDCHCHVFDQFDNHRGGARGEEGVAAPGFQALLRVLRNRDDFWVKRITAA